MTGPKVPPLAWAAFAGMVLIGGSNFVAVKISNEGLAPFWGAFLRFFYASLLLFAFVLVRRVPLPTGRALAGALVYGLTAFGLSYAGAYFVLKEVPSGLLAVLFAAGPLLTMVFASAHGLERFRTRGLVGALVAMAGIGLIVHEQLGQQVRPLVLVLSLLTLVVMSESSVLVKHFPRSHPAGMNAVAMAVGALFLLALSFLTAEPRAAPTGGRVLVAVLYLAVLGSIGLFGLFLYAIARMDVSLLSYQFVLMPIVTLLVANVLIQESVTWSFLLGGIVVALGVYVGLPKPARPAAGPALAAPLTRDAAPRSAESGTDGPRP